MTAEFTTKAWVLIPIAIGINWVGGALVTLLKIPLFLDSIGTIMTAVLAGPWVGALAGLLTNLVLGLTVNPGLIPYAVVNLAFGLVAGYMAVRGWFKSLGRIIVTGLAITATGIVVSAPVTVSLGGVTGSGADLLHAYFLATGATIWQSIVQTSAIIEPIDKIASTLIAFYIARAIPARYRPQHARMTLPGA